MLSNRIIFNIYEKLSWYHLENIKDLIAQSDALWIKHYFKETGLIHQYASYKRQFIELMCFIIDSEWYCPHDYNGKLLDDYWFILSGVKNYENYIDYASDRLKHDRRIVLESVKHFGKSLRYVPDEFKDDHEIVLEAVKNNSQAVEYASDRLKDIIEKLNLNYN
jgi:Domain of unknown function (DUF4116)